MTEKIIISFDDEEEDVLDVNISETKKTEEKNVYTEFKPTYSGYKSDNALTGYNTSGLIYPTGSEKCFGIFSQSELKDEFINHIFQTYEHLILTSLNGNFYAIDKKDASIKHKEHLTGARFEKTGFSFDNKVYINSIDTLYCTDEKFSIKEIYKTQEGHYIWNNLNCVNDGGRISIIINEYNPTEKNGRIILLEAESGEINFSYNYKSENIIPDKIPVSGNYILFFTDGFLNIINNKTKEIFQTEAYFLAEDNPDMLILNDRIYYYKPDNRVYYIEYSRKPLREKFSGITIPGINSLNGYKKYLFAGSGSGWYVYEAGGLQIHYLQDANVFELLQINENVLVASSGKYVYFSNLNIFQESERYLISPLQENAEGNYRVVSAIITGDKVFAVTSNGLMTVFRNDMLNVNV
jgi:hypothetical protein